MASIGWDLMVKFARRINGGVRVAYVHHALLTSVLLFILGAITGALLCAWVLVWSLTDFLPSESETSPASLSTAPFSCICDTQDLDLLSRLSGPSPLLAFPMPDTE